ncbi:stage III sporulation protein AG [Pseudoflavonifractor phocaeensis]|uniref:stage III sporulation protein AG n=1 Tax=Pseudoflavonifractor phocaeensis TaxID=1870988 RepID=UPI0019561450|nr:stage III sporulation protein AG [Pseudoflavonifractor phocaeensis]MBM6870657.1 stage III sporulation protein AG [Pseudoflavonifractor phocaeensis]
MTAETWKSWGKKLAEGAMRYRFVLLVLLAGAALLLWPSGGDGDTADAVQSTAQSWDHGVEALEERLSQVLSQVQGAGEVEVVLSLQTGPRQILAKDSESELGEDGRKEETTVVLSRGSGLEETVTVQQISPQFRGALVVCSGGGDPAVRLALTEAVSALTGLGADKISICQGK